MNNRCVLFQCELKAVHNYPFSWKTVQAELQLHILRMRALRRMQRVLSEAGCYEETLEDTVERWDSPYLNTLRREHPIPMLLKS